MPLPESAARELLREKIASVETQMKASLQEARASFEQAGDKGASAEDAFRRFTRQYLPRRLEVGYGEIIDRKGARSAQTDVVIVNEDHPLTFTQNAPGLFFVEGVCATGEVKSVLTGEGLDKSLADSRTFKQLEMDVGQATMVAASESDLKRFYRCPPWFLFAFESQLALTSVQNRFEEYAKRENIDPTTMVDAAFILDRGWTINFADGKGAYQFRTPDGNSVEGWVTRESKSVLFDMLSWVSAVMPRMVRYRPILPAYMVQTL